MAGLNLGPIGDLGDIGEQFLVWQVLGQLVSAILGPVLVEVQQDVQGRVSRVALSPADAADAVIRGYWTQAQGAKEASLSGIEGDRFQIMVDSAGEPPGLETLVEWARRGIVPWSGAGPNATTVEQGVREGRIKSKWLGAIEAAKYGPLTPGESVAAGLRGNLPLAEAQAKAEEAGVSPEDFQVMVHNAGNPPSPGELVELLRRGLIPLEGVGPDTLSFQQGIYEGDTKDKWWKLYAELGRYIPPPRTVTALLREGSIDDATARQLLEWAGLTGELADAYIKAASKGSATASKDLTRAEVLQLYAQGLQTKAQATAALHKLGLSELDAGELLALQDVKREQSTQTALINRVRTLYLAHHVTQQDAQTALRDIGLSQDEVTHLVTLWNVETSIPTQHVTAAELTSAAYYGILQPDQALRGLVALGFSEWEAWLALSVRLHGKGTVQEVGTPPAWASS